MRLGHGARVHQSLAHALDVWTSRRSHVTTTIHYFDRPGDVYEYGVDSLPLLLAALRAAGAGDLVQQHRDWLQAEIAHFAERVVDPFTGLVRGDRTYSAHRDTCTNRSNAYGNTMVALLAKTIAETGWFASPFERHFRGDYGRLLMEHFWNVDHFRDALGDDTASGEANVWPFYTGVISDPAVITSALDYLDANGFCDPYPLRYETCRRPKRGLAHPPPPARLPGQHGLDEPRLDVPPGAADRRPCAGRGRDRALRRVDRARRHLLGSHELAGRELGQPEVGDDRRGVDALVGDLPRRPRARRPGAGAAFAAGRGRGRVERDAESIAAAA